ncbi:MAG TPA: type II secretion system protein GspD [Gammaproteobacteria bacterium]|nr:type II secretion system protein GspD [Gammaproteobacteria bacterium]
MLLAVVTTALAQPVTLNLKDANISAVIGTISEITGKNFIVDPRVKGKVTIISSRPMESDELYQVFLSVLDVHGFSAIPSGSVIKIVPDASAKQDALPLADERRPGTGDEVVTRVIELHHVSASQLVPILRPLVPQQGHLAAYVPSNILIVSDRAANIERLMDIIKRIDIPSSDAIEIITLQYASASEVVRILTALEQQGGGQKRAAGVSGTPILIADERTNSILIGGGKSGRLRLRTIISHLDTPLANQGNTRVVYLRYAQAKDLVPVLTGVSDIVEQQKKGKAGAGGAAKKIPVNIQADENTNALVITAPADIFRSLESVIMQLDIRRAQVLIESVIAEVSNNLNNELGVEWVVDGTQAESGTVPVGIINLGGGIADILGSIISGTVPSVGQGFTAGAGRFEEGKTRFAVLVRALQGDANTNVLSTPTLVTLDNEEAEIVVGQEVPFVTGAFSTVGSSTNPANPFQTIQRKNVGLTLKVKPQINEGNAIKLDIEQSVDSLNASPIAVDLITNTRSVKTSVLVEDGQIIVLGGLISDNLKETVNKTPLLSDIPLLGALFTRKSTSKEKTNMMVFIHPTIIRDEGIAQNVTRAKYNWMRSRQQEVQDKDHLFIDDDEVPVMPSLDNYLSVPPSFIRPVDEPNGGTDAQPPQISPAPAEQ